MSHTKNRIAIVTGASRGIGAEIVRRLRAEGVAVHALARPSDALEQICTETGATPLPVDLMDTAALEEALDGVAPDILINNAGIITASGPLHTLDASAIDGMVAMNLTAVLHTLRILLPGMIKRGRGDVVLLGSIAGRYPLPNMAAYGITKAAIRALVNGLRLDLHGTGIRVTEVAPGRVETDINLNAMGGDRNAMREKLFANHQASQPGDIADAVMAALTMPRRSNVSFIEVVPTRQTVGGGLFAEGYDETSD
ncbi:MAG: SDR family oxidoreductase [Pseudomonadota bacterium]